MLLAMFTAAAAAQSGVGPEAPDKIDFPEVEGWEKGDVYVYPEPDLGYSVTYQSSEGGNVTIYVYNGGRKKIADGHDSKEVANELKNAKAEIKRVVELGVYEKAESVKSDVVSLGGGIKAVREVMNLTVRGTKLTSEIYVFGHNNQFIKFRATRPFEAGGAINSSVMSLFEAVAKTLSEENTPARVGATEGAMR